MLSYQILTNVTFATDFSGSYTFLCYYYYY